jgi:hypothetical protein
MLVPFLPTIPLKAIWNNTAQLERKPHNAITLSKRKADNINIIITISKCTLGIKE